MFLRTDRQEKRLAAFNAPSRFAAVIGKCVTILILAIATVIVIGRNGHVFWPPLIALLLTALVAGVLVSCVRACSWPHWGSGATRRAYSAIRCR